MLFHKHANKGLAVFQSAKVACVADEEESCLPKSPKAVVRCLSGFCSRGSRVRSQEDSQRVLFLEGRVKDIVRRDSGVLTLEAKVAERDPL